MQLENVKTRMKLRTFAGTAPTTCSIRLRPMSKQRVALKPDGWLIQQPRGAGQEEDGAATLVQLRVCTWGWSCLLGPRRGFLAVRLDAIKGKGSNLLLIKKKKAEARRKLLCFFKPQSLCSLLCPSFNTELQVTLTGNNCFSIGLTTTARNALKISPGLKYISTLGTGLCKESSTSPVFSLISITVLGRWKNESFQGISNASCSSLEGGGEPARNDSAWPLKGPHGAALGQHPRSSTPISTLFESGIYSKPSLIAVPGITVFRCVAAVT